MSNDCPVFRNYLSLWENSKRRECSAEEFRGAALDILDAVFPLLIPYAVNNPRLFSLKDGNRDRLKTYGPFFSDHPETGSVIRMSDIGKELKNKFGIEYSPSTRLAINVYYQVKGGGKAGVALVIFELGEPPNPAKLPDPDDLEVTGTKIIKFSELVTEEISAQEIFERDLRQHAAWARTTGDWELFWKTLKPGWLGDLYTLADRDAKAQQFYLKAVKYFEEAKKWFSENGQAWSSSILEADYCLKAGLKERAAELYQTIDDGISKKDRSLHAIALVNAGALRLGRKYLEERLRRIDSRESSIAELFQSGECFLWLGRYEEAQQRFQSALTLSNVAKDAESTLETGIRGLNSLLQFIITRREEDYRAARKDLKMMLESCFRRAGTVVHARDEEFMDDINKAFDAHEYLKMLEDAKNNRLPSPPSGYRIRGNSFTKYASV